MFLMPENLTLFYAGGFILSSFLGIYYLNKIKLRNQWGFTSILIALITYCLTPFVYLKSLWMVMFIVVMILFLLRLKKACSISLKSS